MKMKKLAAFTGVSALAAFTLASCGVSGAKPDFVMPEEGLTTEEVEITFWHTMAKDIQAILDEQIVEFNKCYPNIKVTHKQIGGYPDVRDQIVQNFGTGDYPNIAYCYPDHVALYNEAQITVKYDELANDPKYGFNGTDLIEKFALAEVTPEKESDMIETYYSEGAQFGDSHRYTIPFLKSTEVLYYNKSFFTEHNLTVPTTWDEMWATCDAIRAIDSKSIPLGYDSEDNMFITMAESYGYGYTSNNSFDFNNEGMRNIVKTLREQYIKKNFITRSTNGNQYTSNVFNNPTLENRMYMCIGSSAGASHQIAQNGAFEVAVANIPGATATTQKAISQGPSLVMLRSEDPQKVLASWLFCQFLLTDFSQASFALATGYLPVTKTCQTFAGYTDSIATKDGYNNLPQLTADFANKNVKNVFTSPVFIGSSIARDEAGSLVKQVLGDETITADNVDAKIQSYFDAAIQKCKYESGL